MPTQIDGQLLYTAREAAEAAQVNDANIYRAVREKRLPVVRKLGITLIPVDAVHEYGSQVRKRSAHDADEVDINTNLHPRREAAKLAGVTDQAITWAIKNGLLPTVEVAGKQMITPTALANYMAARAKR